MKVKRPEIKDEIVKIQWPETISCCKCLQEINFPRSFTNFCGDCEKIFFENRPLESNVKNFVICETCAHNFSECVRCQNSFTPVPHDGFNFKIQKLFTTCSDHPDRNSLYYEKQTIRTLCQECFVHKYEKFNKKTVQTVNIFEVLMFDIKEFYVKNYDLMGPERKSKFFPQNFQEMIELKRWINDVTQLKCFKNCERNAEKIDHELNLTCSECLNETSDPNIKGDSSDPFSNFPNDNKVVELKNVNEVYEILLEKIKSAPSETLSKFLLRLSKTQSLNSDPLFLNLSIKEVKEFGKNQSYRCVNCHVRLSKGNFCGVVNKCGHFFCFNCTMNDFFTQCPLDKIDIQNIEYFNVPDREIMPECHGFHPLIGYKKNIFKLPCKHYSCEDCIHVDKKASCKICATSFDTFSKIPGMSVDKHQMKESKKIKNYVNFMSIECENHGLPVKFIDTYILLLLCDSCYEIHYDKNRLISIENTIVYEWMIKKINHKFVESLKKLSELNFKNLDFIKSAYYFNLMTYQQKIILLKKTFYYLNLVGSIDRINSGHCLEVKRFESHFQVKYDSQKIWRIKNEPNIQYVSSIIIKPNEDFVLEGLIVYGRFVNLIKEDNFHTFSLRNLKIVSLKSLLDNEKNSGNVIHEQNELGIFRELQNKVWFSSGIYFFEEFYYQITFELSEGFYFHGIPFKKLKNDYLSEFKVKFLPSGVKNVGNDYLGGPLAGYIIRKGN